MEVDAVVTWNLRRQGEPDQLLGLAVELRVWVELDEDQVEHVDTVGDRHLVLTVTDLHNTSPKVPEIAAGQVWSLDGVLYMVYRERPLSQAGELYVLNALSGMLEDEEVLKGARLVFDPIEE